MKKPLNTSALITADSPKGQRAIESILGSDFITPEEVTKARSSIVYTDEETHKLAESLPSEDILKWCKDNGYAVMPAPPTAMSLLNILDIESDHFYSKTGGWYADQKFARENKTSFGWLVIKKTPVSNSTRKTWDDQVKLLSVLERVPNAAEMSWFITIFLEVHGIRLFENVCMRCSDLDSDCHRVFVGFGSLGLHVYYYRDANLNELVGLSAARKQ